MSALLDSAIFTPLVGLIGVIVGALLFRLNVSQRARIERSFELHREFYSSDMQEVRDASFALLSKHPNLSASDIYKDDPKGGNVLWVLISFFLRLSLASQKKHVDAELISRLFGRITIYWYEILFRDKIGTGTDETEEIRKLYGFIKSKVPRETFDLWSDNARRQEKQIRRPETSSS